MEARPLIGLAGVLVAALTAEFNDQVFSLTLPDLQGGLGIGSDQGTWLTTLYDTGQVLGMTFSPWFAVTLSVRRWVLAAIALCCATTCVIPLTSILTLLYGLRFLQGFSSGMIIPCLLIVGLRVLAPPIRLYGLAAYALTATVGPNLSATLAALWDDVVWWPFAFYQALPLCAVAAVLVWFGVDQDPPQYRRFVKFDTSGAVLAVLGFTALTIMLTQGDRYDWFNSVTITVLAMISLVTLPLFVFNEFEQELPLFGFFLLQRRNLAYGLTALFSFLLIDLSASAVPLDFLQQVAQFRPIQVYAVTLLLAVVQLGMLPLLAYVLDFESVDARLVSFAGLLCVLLACIGNVFLTSVYQAGGFVLWQSLQAIGQPMIILPLLMMSTNAIRKPGEGPLASALINTCRAIAEPVGAWLLQLIMRWRGALHTSRILDQSGQGRFSVLQAPAIIPTDPPPLLPDGTPRFPGSLTLFMSEVQTQARVLSLRDAFLVFAVLTAGLIVVLLFLPERTYPPRIALARK